MKLRIYCAAAAMALIGNTASALVVGGFNFDDDAFADRAVIALTTSGTLGPAVGVGAAADGDLSTATNLNDSFVEIFFDDNVLINGAGDDLVIFGGTNNNTIRLSTGPQTPPSFVGGPNFIPSSAPGNTSGFSLNGATFDLSDLGFADGAEVVDGLFLSRGGVFTTVWDVGALNSRSVSAVPLPASLPLMLGAIGIFGLVRRLRS